MRAVKIQDQPAHLICQILKIQINPPIWSVKSYLNTLCILRIQVNMKLLIRMHGYKGNNLRHQYGDMHITATASFVRIYAKIMKGA